MQNFRLDTHSKVTGFVTLIVFLSSLILSLTLVKQGVVFKVGAKKSKIITCDPYDPYDPCPTPTPTAIPTPMPTPCDPYDPYVICPSPIPTSIPSPIPTEQPKTCPYSCTSSVRCRRQGGRCISGYVCGGWLRNCCCRLGPSLD